MNNTFCKPAYMKLIFSVAISILFFSNFSCSKEESLENSQGEQAVGSLQSGSTGECLPKAIQGAFIANKALASSNFIEVDVDVITEGSYTIFTDTVNGYYFTGSGDFSSTGVNTIILEGKGKPLAEGVDNFTVIFDSTFCNIEVAVLPASAASPASFTLQPSDTGCMNASVLGDYVRTVPLNSTNKVDIEVNVSSIGSYTISTVSTNGMTFSSSAAFTTKGVQTVSLMGSGAPANAGAISIPLSVGGASCSFIVNVDNDGTTQPPPTETYFWKFISGGATHRGSIDTGAKLETIVLNGITVASLAFEGSSSDTLIAINLGDINGTINANETYSTTSAGTINGLGIAIEIGGITYEANPQITAANVTLKITTHNTGSKVIAGTFSGTLKSSGGQTLTITGGEFNVHYQ
jgi:hypothetical protein